MTGILKQPIRHRKHPMLFRDTITFEMWLSWSLYIQELFGTVENY